MSCVNRLKFPAFRFYSSVTSNPSSKRGPSYYHKTGKHPLVYRTIGQQLEQSCLKYPDIECIVSVRENKRLTYKQILDETDRLAASFLEIGLKRGDKLGIWAPNYTFWYVSFLAAARAGLVSVGINPAYQLNEVEYCINKVQLKAIIAPESFKTTNYYEILKRISPELPDSAPGELRSKKTPSLSTVIINSNQNLPGVFHYEDLFNYSKAETVDKIKRTQGEIHPDWPCNIQFTSGTTGLPKAAVTGHFSCVNNGAQIAERSGLIGKYKNICLQVPFFHISGLVVGILTSLASGSTLVPPDASFSAKASVEAILKEKCSILMGTPTMYVDLIKEVNEKKLKLTTPEVAMIGAASCSPKLLQDMKNELNLKQVINLYGLTESSGAATQSLSQESEEDVLHTVGHVMDHLEVKIIDKAGNAVQFGRPGELCLRGHTTCLGYYEDEAKTKELIDEYKWLRTGDQCILREDGYVQIVGRLKELVIRGGENIFPKEIEDFLNTHPSILENHVIGVPDERYGEEICAYIRLKDGAPEVTLDDIKTFSKGQIAHFKVPRYIRLVNEFPKTGSGKIQKFKLVEQFMATKSIH